MIHYALSDRFLAQGGRNENRLSVRSTEIERKDLLFIPTPSAPYLWDPKLEFGIKNQKNVWKTSRITKPPSSLANCAVPSSLELQHSKALSRIPPFFFVNRCNLSLSSFVPPPLVVPFWYSSATHSLLFFLFASIPFFPAYLPSFLSLNLQILQWRTGKVSSMETWHQAISLHRQLILALRHTAVPCEPHFPSCTWHPQSVCSKRKRQNTHKLTFSPPSFSH